MANDKAKADKDKAPAYTPPTGSGDMEGFTPIGPAEGARYYFKVLVGAWIRGEVLGRFKRRDKEQYYYQIKLTAPCESVAMREDPNDPESEFVVGTAPPNTVVNVDERSALEDLKPLAEDTDRVWEVFLQAESKVKLDGGNTVWRFKRFRKPLRKRETPF